MIGSVPNHADTREALQFLREDMLQLRDGFMAPHTRFDSGHTHHSLVFSSIAAVLSDSPEGSLYCMHSGHMSTLYCRKCVKQCDSQSQRPGNTATFTTAVCDFRLRKRAD